MKTLIIALVASLFILSCSKEGSRSNNEIPAYIGEYNSTKGDTAFVSQNGEYLNIEWNAKDGGYRWKFDSVRVHQDLTISDNEKIGIVIHTPPYYQWVTSVGTGAFGTNTLQFYFVVDGNRHLKFEGIKRN
jgi:hypothetical protein